MTKLWTTKAKITNHPTCNDDNDTGKWIYRVFFRFGTAPEPHSWNPKRDGHSADTKYNKNQKFYLILLDIRDTRHAKPTRTRSRKPHKSLLYLKVRPFGDLQRELGQRIFKRGESSKRLSMLCHNHRILSRIIFIASHFHITFRF